jgi:hypothetical protein
MRQAHDSGANLYSRLRTSQERTYSEAKDERAKLKGQAYEVPEQPKGRGDVPAANYRETKDVPAASLEGACRCARTTYGQAKDVPAANLKDRIRCTSSKPKGQDKDVPAANLKDRIKMCQQQT